MSVPRPAALLLAAGLSSRMGRSKALLPWHGVPLVLYQVAQLRQAGCDPVIVVTGHEHASVESVLAETGASAVYNPDYQLGRAGSVRAGAAAISAAADPIVILNVDQPRSAEVIRRLLDEHRAGRSLLTVPAYAGRRGHPLVLSGSLRAELLRVTEELEGLRAVTRAHAQQRREVAWASDEVVLDLNTPESYQAASAAGERGDE